VTSVTADELAAVGIGIDAAGVGAVGVDAAGVGAVGVGAVGRAGGGPADGAAGAGAVSVEAQVIRLARLAVGAGCHGVVAAPADVAAVRAAIGPEPLVVATGIRLPGDSDDEHTRADSPAAALGAGATHLVLGRSITRAPDPAAILRALQRPLTPGAAAPAPADPSRR